MGQALYRKYRSKSLDEIVGQEHITQTLGRALKAGRISHAYLFTGPHGVGKTSIARILAHAVNGLPYTDDSSHMDIIEIDAASNRRIDEIRELREKVYVAPTSAAYKVYIIDEVHMLTKEAFNALLKTLEEPPNHVVFILATTDAHKLPPTIISRTQRFSFKPIETAKVVAHLRSIAEQEGLRVSDEALELLAEHGEGSFRDSISLLDQASRQDQAVSADEVRQLLGIPPQTALEELLAAISHGSPLSTIAQALAALYDQGYQATAIAQQLGQMLRQQIVHKPADNVSQTLDLLADLLSVPTAHEPERYLEIVLLRPRQSASSTRASRDATRDPSSEKPVKPSDKRAAKTPPTAPTVGGTVVEAAPKPQASEPAVSKSLSTKPAGNAAFDATIWPILLQALKQRHNTLYGVVRMAQPQFAPGELTLAFSFAFHQKRINEARNQQLLADIVQTLTGQAVQISCVVDKNATPPRLTIASAAKNAATAELTTISNIFGGAELLES